MAMVVVGDAGRGDEGICGGGNMVMAVLVVLMVKIWMVDDGGGGSGGGHGVVDVVYIGAWCGCWWKW